MAKNRTYNEPKRLSAKEDEKQIKQFIFENAARGISQKSIAVKLGLTMEEFATILMMTTGGVKPFQIALDQGRAIFEEENVNTIESILDDPEASQGLKYKAARENLRTMEEWAPATRAVKLQVQDSAQVFTFEAYSPEQQEAIQAQHNVDDNDDSEEDQS